MSSSTVQTLTGNIPSSSANDALFTTLCTHKDDADRINASRLAQVCDHSISRSSNRLRSSGRGDTPAHSLALNRTYLKQTITAAMLIAASSSTRVPRATRWC